MPDDFLFSPIAMFHYKIGSNLIHGYHIEKDPVKGAYFIKKAYENGWLEAAAYWLKYDLWKYEVKGIH